MHGHRALSVVGMGAQVGVAGLRWPEEKRAAL